MRADGSRPGPGSLGSICSVVAAAAFGALPVVSAVSAGFTVSHPWLFAIGAVGFLSNLKGQLHPAWRTLAAVGEAMCVFEVLGFAVGVTFMAFAGPAGWQMVEWWLWVGTWGLACVSVGALLLPALDRRERS